MSDQKSVDLYNDLEEEEKRKCEASYRHFLWAAWDVIEPSTPIIWNWHLDYLCDELQKQAIRIANKEPKEYDLLINVPPRSAKSTLLTKAFNPWVWTIDPSQRFLTASYSDSLSVEHAVSSRRIIQSSWYQSKWGDKYSLTTDQNVKSHFENDETGYRITTSVGGTGTGRGGIWNIVDDPISAEEALSETYRRRAITWWTDTMPSRLNSQEIGIRAIIMQRLNENDITGYILKKQGHRYKHICLPAEESDSISPPELRKYYKGGLMAPEQFSRSILAGIKEIMLEFTYAGQYQQLPAPPEGGLFKREWWRFWMPVGSDLPQATVKNGDSEVPCETIELPKSFDDSVASWDCAFKDKDKNDFVSGQVWASYGPKKFLLDRINDHMDYPRTVEEVVALNSKRPNVSGTLIENAANGPAVVADVGRILPGVIGVTPQGSKQARAMPMARQAKAGNIYLPHPAVAPWVEKYINQFADFPNAAHDDDVDSATQAINHLTGIKRVWDVYDGKTVPFKVDFKNLERDSMLICSQWTEKNLVASCILTVWNPRKHVLAIFDEYISSTTRPEVVITGLSRAIKDNSNGYIPNMHSFSWFANSLMFNKTATGGDMRAAYSKYRIQLRKNVKYDEDGAILHMSRLIFKKGVIVHSRCRELSRQMSSWAMDGKQPSGGHALARAACNIVSNLFEVGAMEHKSVPIKAYSKAKTALLKRNEQLVKSGDFKEVARREMGHQSNKGSWMV